MNHVLLIKGCSTFEPTDPSDPLWKVSCFASLDGEDFYKVGVGYSADTAIEDLTTKFAKFCDISPVDADTVLAPMFSLFSDRERDKAATTTINWVDEV